MGTGSYSSASSSVTPKLLLLDVYAGAASAYSLRLLRSSYSGPVVRVRRSVDNSAQDFNAASVAAQGPFNPLLGLARGL